MIKSYCIESDDYVNVAYRLVQKFNFDLCEPIGSRNHNMFFVVFQDNKVFLKELAMGTSTVCSESFITRELMKNKLKNL